MTSVIIAAHNEAAVIAGLLTALTKDNHDFDIVVVCNGCSDNTAEIARTFGHPVRVIETEVANKANALNLGDEAALDFPRIYVDGDITVDGDTIMALSQALQNGDFLAAGVAPIMDTAGCSAGVKAFYSIKNRLPSSRVGMAGSGLYAMSEAGRKRFEKFPAVVSDDLFARVLFNETERTTLPGRHSVVYAAKTVKALLIQRTRSAFGSGQVAQLYPELLKNNSGANSKALLALFCNPFLWASLAIYIYVTFRSKLKAKRLLREAGYFWEREQSSRAGRNLSAEKA
jgi:glycosyltransferase involved in cell wall biosynthesis